MKLMQVAFSLNGGGAERALVEQSIGLRERGDWEIVVVNLSGTGVYEDRLRAEGIKVINLYRQKRQLAAILKDLVSIAMTEKPDLVQSWMYFSDLVASIAFFGRCPVIWGVRNSEPTSNSSMIRILFIHLLGLMSHIIPRRIISVSKSGARNHASSYLFAGSKFEVIPNFSNFHATPLGQKGRLRVRKLLELEDKHFLIGSVSRMNPAKGHDFLVKCAARVLEQEENAVFCVVGIDDPAAYFEQYPLPSELRSRFRVVGFQKDVADFFQAFDLFFLHSETEGFPNVLLEAIKLKRPVLATDVGDVGEIVGNNRDVIVQYGDASQAVAKICKAKYHKNAAAIEQMYAQAQSDFGREQLLDKLDRIYKESLER